jgi:hypothetical protein
VQPVNVLRPNAISASSSDKPRRFFQPNRQSVIASIEPGNKGFVLRRDAMVVVEVVIVSAVWAIPSDGVTVAGKKLHNAPEGNPEQLNETGEANEFWGVTRTVVVALCPEVTVSDAGLTASV